MYRVRRGRRGAWKRKKRVVKRNMEVRRPGGIRKELGRTGGKGALRDTE